MTDKPNDMLLLAGKVLTIIMQGLTAFGAFILFIGGLVVLFASNMINAEVTAEHGDTVGALPVLPALGVIALLFACAALVFLFFGKLRAIISTVGEGEPFVPDNAERLNLMAWLLLVVQVLAIPLVGLAMLLAEWAQPMEDSDITVNAGFDLTSILMVIILFILARVFKHGAEMREDLEGTV